MARIIWLLICGLSFTPNAATALDFKMLKFQNGYAVVAEGKIEAADPAMLEAIIEIASEQNKPLKVLYLISPGGDLGAGIELGKLIREASVDTMVPPDMECMSACAMTFLGGVTRYVGEGAALGVHQFLSSGGDAQIEQERAQYLSGLLLLYFKYLGADQNILMAALMTPPEQIYVFTRPELLSLGLVSN